VEIDLIVRGICRLRGRFLEHSRIFYFRNAGSPEYFLGSADWMTRNLDARVEATVPIEDPRLQEEIRAILDLQLADNVKAWDMQADGSYVQRSVAPGDEARSSQDLLMQRAAERLGR
jgi:polyphosphate kinase